MNQATQAKQVETLTKLFNHEAETMTLLKKINANLNDTFSNKTRILKNGIRLYKCQLLLTNTPGVKSLIGDEFIIKLDDDDNLCIRSTQARINPEVIKSNDVKNQIIRRLIELEYIQEGK